LNKKVDEFFAIIEAISFICFLFIFNSSVSLSSSACIDDFKLYSLISSIKDVSFLENRYDEPIKIVPITILSIINVFNMILCFNYIPYLNFNIF